MTEHHPPPAIELTGITVRFERTGQEPLTVVEDVYLNVVGGAIHCLAGRSGSGKTTLLSVATGAIAPTAGTVSWGGKPITGLSETALAAARRHQLAYVDQEATAIGELTVLDNVLLPAIAARKAASLEDRAHELLESFGLGAHARQRARSVSGGERQRMALARALLMGPTAIALDEPTSSLDRNSADTVIEALRQATSHGAAVLVASHDPGVINAADSMTRLD